MKSLRRRSQPAEEVIEARQDAVESALRELAVCRNLSPDVVRELRAALDRPASVHREQWRIGFAPNAQLRIKTPNDPPPFFVMPRSEAEWLRKVLHGRGDVLTSRKVSRPASRESEQRAVRRLQRRFLTDPDPFRRSGRPSYPYRWPVIQYIEVIEDATGTAFPLARPRSRGGAPSGIEMRLLQAALDRALFASGPPPAETIALIVRERREQRRHGQTRSQADRFYQSPQAIKMPQAVSGLRNQCEATSETTWPSQLSNRKPRPHRSSAASTRARLRRT
jgi:hypothetical protein